jgi:hypothetical protein
LNGTVVSLPHSEQVVRVSTLGYEPGAEIPSADARFDLQALQRFGSFLNCLSWKKSCSPAVNTKSAPQSTHFSILSWNSIKLPSTPRSAPLALESQRRHVRSAAAIYRTGWTLAQTFLRGPATTRNSLGSALPLESWRHNVLHRYKLCGLRNESSATNEKK